MRTTVVMSEHIYRAAKARAAEDGRSVSELIEDAVAMFLRGAAAPSPDVRPLTVFGGSGVLRGIDLADTSSLRDAMETDMGLDALR